jgi:hypothetical protein
MGAHVLYVRELLLQRGASETRSSLQQVGAELEISTGGSWLLRAVEETLSTHRREVVVVDSVRTSRQAKQLAELADNSILIYLRASDAALARRFRKRIATSATDATSFRTAAAHPTEIAVNDVALLADNVIETTGVPRLGVFRAVRQLLV